VLDRIAPDAAGQRLHLPLPDGEPLEIVLIQADYRAADDFTWIGQIAGVAFSDVIVVRYKDALRIIARDQNPDVPYIEVRPSPLGVHLVTATDRNFNDDCVGALTPPEPAPGEGTPPAEPGGYGPRASNDPTNRIDVLVVPSQNSRNAYGNESAFIADAQAMIADANLRISSSGGGWTARLCASGWAYGAGYNDSGDIGTDLGRLRSSTDGFMDGVHTDRSLHRPDIIALIVEGGGAGVGYRPSVPGHLNASSGYFVSSRSAAIGNGTFGHELGHNMGGCHNAEQNDCAEALNSAPRGLARFCDGGLFYSDIEYRTTMSYVVNSGVTSTRIQRYSVNGLQVVRTGTFGEEICRLNMWDGGAQSMTVFEVSRPSVSQYNVISTQTWAQPGATANQGLFQWPYGRVRDAVINVKGGTAQGVARAKAGSYAESSGGPTVLRNPCVVRSHGGAAILR